MSLSIKVVRVPGAVTDLELEDGATVADALRAASITVGSGEAVKVNGGSADANTRLSNNDRVIVSAGAKGN